MQRVNLLSYLHIIYTPSLFISSLLHPFPPLHPLYPPLLLLSLLSPTSFSPSSPFSLPLLSPSPLSPSSPFSLPLLLHFLGYQAVLDIDPQYVVRRFESGRYAVDTDVRRIYMRALQLAEVCRSHDPAT